MFYRFVLFVCLFVAAWGDDRICPDEDSFNKVCIQFKHQCQPDDGKCSGDKKCCLVAGCGNECLLSCPQPPEDDKCDKKKAPTEHKCGNTTKEYCPEGTQCCKSECGFNQCIPVGPPRAGCDNINDLASCTPNKVVRKCVNDDNCGKNGKKQCCYDVCGSKCVNKPKK